MTWKSDSVEPSDKALFISSLLLSFNEQKDDNTVQGTISPFCLVYLVLLYERHLVQKLTHSLGQK